jgi:hypothetical protein
MLIEVQLYFYQHLWYMNMDAILISYIALGLKV